MFPPRLEQPSAVDCWSPNTTRWLPARIPEHTVAESCAEGATLQGDWRSTAAERAARAAELGVSDPELAAMVGRWIRCEPRDPQAGFGVDAFEIGGNGRFRVLRVAADGSLEATDETGLARAGGGSADMFGIGFEWSDGGMTSVGVSLAKTDDVAVFQHYLGPDTVWARTSPSELDGADNSPVVEGTCPLTGTWSAVSADGKFPALVAGYRFTVSLDGLGNLVASPEELDVCDVQDLSGTYALRSDLLRVESSRGGQRFIAALAAIRGEPAWPSCEGGPTVYEVRFDPTCTGATLVRVGDWCLGTRPYFTAWDIRLTRIP